MSGTAKMVGKTPVKNDLNTKREPGPSSNKQSPKSDRIDKQQGGQKSQSNHGGGQGGRGTWQKPQDKQGAKQADKNEDTDNVGDKRKDDAKKFTGRCRLFVGNLSQETTEAEFRKLFEPYGEISEVYLNTAKGFGFIRLDYRHNADAAKAALDGMQIGNSSRVLRVRFATHGAALKVKNLHPCVSNELLESAFQQFGDVERAIVIVDDRGKSMGEGIVEFSRKPGAAQALKRITDGVFILTSSPRPVTVEPLEQRDDEDGLSEKFIMKNDEYKKEREKEPRLAPHGSFEFEFGQRWKRLAQIEAQQLEQVKTQMEQERMKLEDDMENAMFEHQADLIRQDLMRQQEELRRMEEARQKDRMRKRQDMEMRQQGMSDQFMGRMDEERRRAEMMRAQNQSAPEEQMRRRMQEHAAGFGAQARQEEMFRQQQGVSGGGGVGGMHDGRQKRGGGGNTPMQPPPVPPVALGLGRGNTPNQMPGGGEEIQGENSGNFNQGNQNMPGGPAAQAQMRPSRFDQPPAGKFGGGGGGQGNFPQRGMGGGRGGQGQAAGGGQGQARGNMFPEQGQGERRREAGPREEFTEMKRMRRY